MRDNAVISNNTGSVIVNRSTLNNVTLTIDGMTSGAAEDRAALRAAVAALLAAIEELPDSAAGEGARLARKTEELVTDIAGGADAEDRRGMLAAMGRIGEKLLDVAPKIQPAIEALSTVIDKFA